jgi:hypothetical protein
MFLLQCLVIAGALASGLLVARVVSHALDAAAERERRANNLLALAPISTGSRTANSASPMSPTRAASSTPPRAGADRPHAVGARAVGIGAAELDAHRADLEAHRPFSGVLVRREDPQGRSRVHSVSGEPRFGDDGIFAGYWGVARDVTEELRTQRASVASETRYRELFERSPSAALPAPARHRLRRQPRCRAAVRLRRPRVDARHPHRRPVRAGRPRARRRADRALETFAVGEAFR